jgi:hypothetical protein
MKNIAISFLILIISSCSVFEEDDTTRPIPTDSILINDIADLKVNFSAIIECGSMCWKETYYKSSINGDDVYIKTFAVTDGSAVCPAVCVETEIPISIKLMVPGSYTFHFWRSDTSSIDTTLILGI